MRRGYVTPLASHVLSAVAWIVAFESLAAQPRISSRSAFLSAAPAEIEAALRPTDPTNAEELDRLVSAQLPAVAGFFGLNLRYRWVDFGGSVSHPDLGIFLDKRQLARMRDSVGTNALDDVVRFVLAHEAAHLAQHQIYSRTTMEDATRLRAIECDADLWAGMAVANVLADLGVAPDSGIRIQRAAALAFSIGVPDWDDPQKHPRPEQRAVCVSTGFNAGLHLRLVRAYERIPNPTLLALLSESRELDPSFFGPGDDVWLWTNGRAKAITEADGARIERAGDPVDWFGRFRILVTAAERGAVVLRRDAAILGRALGPKGWMTCSLTDGAFGTSLLCETQPFASTAMARASFVNEVGMLASAIAPLGWAELNESNEPVAGAVLRCFARSTEDTARICVKLDPGARRFSITTSARH